MFAEASAKSVATPFTGAWGDTQLALTNVVVQSIPDLSEGSVSDARPDGPARRRAEGGPVGRSTGRSRKSEPP